MITIELPTAGILSVIPCEKRDHCERLTANLCKADYDHKFSNLILTHIPLKTTADRGAVTVPFVMANTAWSIIWRRHETIIKLLSCGLFVVRVSARGSRDTISRLGDPSVVVFSLPNYKYFHRIVIITPLFCSNFENINTIIFSLNYDC